MAKLPNQKRVLREDLKDAPSWIDRLITPLNSFMESVYYALNKNITFNENIASQIKEIEFTTLSTYSTASPKIDGFQVIQFPHSLKNKPFGVTIQQITEKSGTYNPITSPVCIDWYDNNGVININYITGLEDSKTYIIRLLVL